MKQLYAFFVLLIVQLTSAQIVNIPDPAFKAYLLSANSTNLIASNQPWDYSVGFFIPIGMSVPIDTNNDGEIQVAEAQAITYLDVDYYNTSIQDLTGLEAFINLEGLNLKGSSASTFTLPAALQNLEGLRFGYSAMNLTIALNLPLLPNLKAFDSSITSVTGLNLSLMPNLEYLHAINANLTSFNKLDVPLLKYLDITQNNIPNLDISNMTHLETVKVGSSNVQQINLTGSTNLKFLNCSSNQLTDLNVSGLVNLETLLFAYNQVSNINLSGLSNLTTLGCSSNLISILDLSSQDSMVTLNCEQNLLTTLDLLHMTNLENLDCSSNLLTTLNVSSLTLLKTLKCSYNQIGTLDLSGLSDLFLLECNDNLIQDINFFGVTNLIFLRCSENQLTSLTISDFPNLDYLDCKNNLLSNLILNNLYDMSLFDCSNNLLSSLDLTTVPNFSFISFACGGNQIQTLSFKNGVNSSLSSVYLSPNPMVYICVDEDEVPWMQNIIEQQQSGLSPTCHTNSFCTFTPGGAVSTFRGVFRHDSNASGCDPADFVVPSPRISISNGTNTASYIGNANGQYSYSVQDGTFSITPQLENPTYFTVTPPNYLVTFPATPSPFTQDFCLTSVGVAHDLEAVIVPTDFAVPGFESSYSLLVKNKGNQNENVTLSFTFNDAVMNFTQASIAPTSSTVGLLTWNLGVIAPFETRTVNVTFVLNTPTAVPSLNANDVLNFQANVAGLSTDVTPLDNSFDLAQTVFNSYDPNDKTCLQGTVIDPAEIGSYVYYRIRFENTGTFPARNVVIKDVINPAMFDISTLRWVHSSHSGYAQIQGNEVRFIFENIQLPFEDDSNDGYVVFKIKTLPTLTLNSTISNTASIYFDFNYPIITNTETSIFTTLDVANFQSDAIDMFPVPAENTLQIVAPELIKSVSITDSQGRLLWTQLGDQATLQLDMQALPPGVYLIQTTTIGGKYLKKVLKK